MKLVKMVVPALMLVASLATYASAGVPMSVIAEEHVNGGVTQLNWLPGYDTPRTLLGMTLDPSDPAWSNPSGDHTVGVLTNTIQDSGGIALSAIDPQGQADYTWEGWFFTGAGNTRRGLILRGSVGDNFKSSYQFVLYSGMAQLIFRKLQNQTPTTLRSYVGPAIPGGIPLVNTWHHLKVEAIANQFRLWYDGVELTAGNPVFDNTDPLLTGFVGVYNFRFDLGNVPVYFDDLVLSTQNVVPTRTTTWGAIKNLYK